MPRATRARKPTVRTKIPRRRRVIRILQYGILAVLCLYVALSASLLFLRWVDPPTTAVQLERRFGSWFSHEPYRKRYRFVALSHISPNLQHAVIAAEDERFYQHHGFDWQQIGNAVQEDLEEGRRRGASTITQQLVRNLFLSTSPSLIRKGLEFSMVPLAEALLSKRRILELYLNVIEWGPGIYGAEAAARSYYREPALALSRDQAAELAAILPAPLRRHPGQPQWYIAIVRAHMRQMGW